LNLFPAVQNDIPVFSPALTDGSLGDMIFFHMISHPEFVLDIAEDVFRINNLALASPCSGMIILGKISKTLMVE
jgi:deoxyhypusine synthase